MLFKYRTIVTELEENFNCPAQIIFLRQSPASLNIAGDNVTWSLDDQGVLTFSGSGEMYDYDFESQPWMPYRDVISKIVVEEGITSIGAGAFWATLNYMPSGGLVLPSTLETIGDYAFTYCMGLKTVYVPDNVTSIGKWAFCTAGGIDTIYVGSGIRNIGAHAFDHNNVGDYVTVYIDAYRSQVTLGETAFGEYAIPVFLTCDIHSWSDAACTEKRTCTVCGEVETTARGHQEESIPGKDATCTATGLTEGKKCSVCGTITVGQTEIPAKGHSEVVIPGKAPTLTETGLTEGKRCVVCGVVTVVQQTIPANEDLNGDGYHDGDVAVINAIIENNGLDWTKDDPASWGWRVEWKLERVNRCTSLNVVGESLSGTLDVSGLTKLTYLDCSYTDITELNVAGLNNLMHLNCSSTGIAEMDVADLTNLTYLNYSETSITELDVTGLTNLTHLICRNTGITELDITGQTNLILLYCENTDITELDLSNLLKLESLCANGTALRTIRLPAGHIVGANPSGSTVPFSLPIPIRSGYTFTGWYTAETGGELVKNGDTFVEATTLYAQWENNCTHVWDEAACTERRICAVCGEMETQVRGHQVVIIPGKAATCTETGLSEGKKCSACDEIFVAQKDVAKLAHTEEVIPGKAATCKESGLTEGKKCAVCGEILAVQETIEKLPHTEEVIPGKAPGCIEIGLTEGRKCSVCGDIVIAQTAIPAIGHSWDNGTVNVVPTCTLTGIKTYVCTHEPSHTRTEVLPVREHTDGNADGQCDACKLQLSCTVTFDVAGGKPAPKTQTTSVGGYLTEPETPTRKNHGFRGWFPSDDDSRAWDFTRDLVEENMTLVAHWYKNRHQIQGNIYQHNGGEPGRPIKLTLKLGNTIIYETQTDRNGFYQMADIPAGIYNLVVEDPDGGIKTVVVEVREDGKMKGINLPEHNVVSELIVPDEAGNEITVGGLDEVADDHHQGDTRVTVTMTAGKTEDITAEESETDDKKAQKEAQKAIKEQAKNNNGNGNQPEEEVQEFVFLDIRIEKTEGQQNEDKEEITETSGLLEIRVPVETNGRRAFKVYRHHGDQVDELTEQPNALGEYIEIHDGFVVIHASRFSMYAVASEICAHEMRTRYSWSARGCDVIHECALCDDPLVETTETVQFWLEDGALKLSHLPEDLHLLVCGYEGGQFTGSQLIQDPKLTNPLSVEGDTIKLFLLQNDGSWQPLANAKNLR